MVEKAQEQKGKAQQFIEKFGKIYSPIILTSALLIIAVPFALGINVSSWATRSVVFIVAAAPCALVMSTPVSIAAGIGKAGRRGVLIKGGVHIENLGKVKVVALDKTGTLTTGKLEVTDTIGLDGEDNNTILHLAHSVEDCSEHPIAVAINLKGASCPIKASEISEFKAIIGYGAEARIEGERIYVGQPDLFEKLGIDQIWTERYRPSSLRRQDGCPSRIGFKDPRDNRGQGPIEA